MLKISFLCSGGGGNLKFLLHALSVGALANVQISGVIVDRECAAGQFAKKAGIPVFQIDFSEPGQSALISRLKLFEPDLIITTVHKILSPEAVKAFESRLINLHYSLLPAFGGSIGQTPVKKALAYGTKLLGVTLHRVTSEVDAGRPLVQAAIASGDSDKPDSVMDALFRGGCLCLAVGIQLLQPGVSLREEVSSMIIEVHARPMLISPALASFFSPEYSSEAFWQALKHDSPEN